MAAIAAVATLDNIIGRSQATVCRRMTTRTSNSRQQARLKTTQTPSPTKKNSMTVMPKDAINLEDGTSYDQPPEAKKQQQEEEEEVATLSNEIVAATAAAVAARKHSEASKKKFGLIGTAELPQACETTTETLIRPTLKRYLILMLFCLNAGNKAFQWIQVPSATTKATILYGVDNYVINLASIIFMVSFLVLSWPACYIIKTLGLRRAVLVASFGTSVGAIVKCFSCHEDGVWLLMAGSIVVSLSEQLIFSVPSRLASVWFPDHQVSMAVAMCVVGNQVGVALGFLVPHWCLREAETRAEIGAGFQFMFVATAVFSVVIFLICVLAFDEAPQMAPGAARLKQLQLEHLAVQLEQEHEQDEAGGDGGGGAGMARQLGHLFRQIFQLCANRQLMIMAASYGIVVGINYTIQTLLDQMISPAWPEAELLVGQTGFVIIVAGILTTPLWGRAMDHWHAYKQINVIIAFGNCLSLAAFTYALIYTRSQLILQLAALAYGLFSVGYCVSALEYAVELTYPAPELVTSSIMNVVPMLAGTTFILLGSYLTDTYGNLVACSFNVLALVIGLLLALSTREQLRRQEAINQSAISDNSEKPQLVHL